jgi:hypothetical protein
MQINVNRYLAESVLRPTDIASVLAPVVSAVVQAGPPPSPVPDVMQCQCADHEARFVPRMAVPRARTAPNPRQRSDCETIVAAEQPLRDAGGSAGRGPGALRALGPPGMGPPLRLQLPREFAAPGFAATSPRLPLTRSASFLAPVGREQA